MDKRKRKRLFLLIAEYHIRVISLSKLRYLHTNMQFPAPAVSHNMAHGLSEMDLTHKVRPRYIDTNSGSSTARLQSPEFCLSPPRSMIPPLQLFRLSTESLTASCSSLRGGLSDDRGFTSPRVVRASHTLNLPTSPRRPKRLTFSSACILLRGRRISANLLLDRPRLLP